MATRARNDPISRAVERVTRWIRTLNVEVVRGVFRTADTLRNPKSLQRDDAEIVL